jgi:hypothetical protein
MEPVGRDQWVQTDRDHDGSNSLQLCPFEVFGAVVRLQ